MTIPWYFDDVVHDHDTAHDAAHTLGFGAIGLEQALALLIADIPVVVEDWRGRARWVFDEQMPAIVESGKQLSAVLQTATAGVMSAHERASLEADLRAELRAAPDADAAADTAGGRGD